MSTSVLLWEPAVLRRMVWWLLCPAALAAVVTATCGGVGLGLLVGQAAVGVALLEVINYVEARMSLHIACTRLRASV